jgi:hypothetical protein
VNSNSSVRTLVRTAIALAALALAACGSSTPTGSNPTASPTAKAQAACTVDAAMVPITAKFNTATTHVTVFPPNGDLKCASGVARISVLIGPSSAPANGPQGTDHLVLLLDQGGRWVIANDILCNSQGYPTRKTPPELGILCGFQ